MKEFKIALNSRSMKLVQSIIKAEDLEVSVTIQEDALGDTNIKVRGAGEEIDVLKSIYKMAA